MEISDLALQFVQNYDRISERMERTINGMVEAQTTRLCPECLASELAILLDRVSATCGSG
jgi:hypothetical protein